MIHAFRLGPVTTSPAPSFAYAAVVTADKVEIRFAGADLQGLAALREAVKGQPYACEPDLAEVAGLQKLEVAPLPPEVLAVRAQLAYELASGIDHGASRPEAIDAFLRAAAAFWASRAWELIDAEEQLHLAFTVGRGRAQGELSIQAADRNQPRLVLCDDPGQQAKLHGLTGAARVAELCKAGGLSIDLSTQPAWACGAIEAHYKLPRVPVPERKRHGRAASVATIDLVMAAAMLQTVVAYADSGDGAEVEQVVEAGPLRVRARLGPTPPDGSAMPLEEGLTPVFPGSEPEEVTPAAAATPTSTPKEDEDDAPLSPAELAALMKGGPLPAKPKPKPAPPPDEDDESPLSPAELAALLKGGPATPKPEPEPQPEPQPEPEPEPEPAPEKPLLTDDGDDAPLSPAELAALLKGGPATPEAPPPPPEPPLTPPAPAEPALTPAAPAPPPDRPYQAPSVYEPRPQPDGAPHEDGWYQADAGAPSEPGPESPSRPGWLSRAWTALRRRDRTPPPESAPQPESEPQPKPAPKPQASKPAPKKPPAPPKPRPPAAPQERRGPPPELPPPDPSVPFSAFARALRVAVPVEPAPPPPEELEAAATLAASIKAGASERERFVSFPAVALQLIELVQAPDADARNVAGFISRDPGLAADVLAVANSVLYRGVSEAASVRDAVARLGLKEVGRVASAVSARALLVPARAGGGAASTALFTRAVAVATAASATALRVRGANSDQVWLAGLLHDVGLALAASELHRLSTAGGEAVPTARAERAVEAAHAEVGAAALKAWGLPQYLGEITAHHHDEGLPAGPALVDLHLVRLTSALARLAEPGAAARAAREIMSSAEALGFDVHAVRALAGDLKAAEQRAAVLVR